jgi:hypothetical protein
MVGCPQGRGLVLHSQPRSLRMLKSLGTLTPFLESVFGGRAHLKKLGQARDFKSRLVLGSEWLISLSMSYAIKDGGMQSRHPFRNSQAPAFLSTSQAMQELYAIGRTPAGAGIPAGLGLVGAIVSHGDILERARFGERTVAERVEESNRVPQLLVHQRDQASP